MKLTTLSLAAALLLAPASAAFAQTSTWTIDPNHSQSDFQIRHMGVSTVRGSISKVSGTIVWDEKDVTKDSVVADIDATTVSTTQPQRDTHLKSADFFNVEKFPTIHFQSTSVKRENGKIVVLGNLTLAGVTKQVTLDVDGPVAPQKGAQGGLVSGFSASTTIRRSDFNFGTKFAPPMIGDEVKITIDVEMDKK